MEVQPAAQGFPRRPPPSYSSGIKQIPRRAAASAISAYAMAAGVIFHSTRASNGCVPAMLCPASPALLRGLCERPWRWFGSSFPTLNHAANQASPSPAQGAGPPHPTPRKRRASTGGGWVGSWNTELER